MNPPYHVSPPGENAIPSGSLTKYFQSSIRNRIFAPAMPKMTASTVMVLAMFGSSFFAFQLAGKDVAAQQEADAEHQAVAVDLEWSDLEEDWDHSWGLFVGPGASIGADADERLGGRVHEPHLLRGDAD